MDPHIPHHKVEMIPRISIISDSEVSIMVFSAMFTLLYSSTNQELFEKYICNHYEKYDHAVRPIYRLKLKYPLPLSVNYF